MTDAFVDGLSVRALTVQFGGLVAVETLSLDAPVGTLTGLIGPNGAGKTTTFNACTGLVGPTRGRIHLFGDDVTGLAPPARARRGLGRTFQRMELFDSLPVRTNVALGRIAGLAGSNPIRHLVARRSERDEVDRVVTEALGICGIEPLADVRAGSLSTGQRRLVELARAVAGSFRVLLLDEPSSGLDREETAALGRILRDLVEQRDVGILLVEHDMALVMEVCDHVYVLDFGRLLFTGTPADVQSSEIVRTAYLGGDAEAV